MIYRFDRNMHLGLAATKALPEDAIQLLARLRRLEVSGCDRFESKLRENRRDGVRVVDLMSEGYAAVTFAEAGLQVEMAEAPDLWVTIHGTCVGAEVKHFRRKEQDKVDEISLAQAIRNGRLVEYGDPRESGEEGRAWEQVLRKAKEVAGKIRHPYPLILVVHSDSDHCVEEGDVLTACHEVNDQLRNGLDSPLAALSGFLHMGGWTAGHDCRNTHFFATARCNYPLDEHVAAALANIRRWCRHAPLAS